MAFTKEFEDIYEVGIKPACKDAGAACQRVDEQMFLENILSRIYGQIGAADIIVAEVTGRNPNVLYETGYAHGIGKRVIFVTQNVDDIPFDLKHYPHILYGESISTLKRLLEGKIRWCIENPPEKPVVVGPEDAELSRMAKHITNYLHAKSFRKVGFERIRDSINQKYSDDLLLELIDKSPDIFRRVQMKGGKQGIGLVVHDAAIEQPRDQQIQRLSKVDPASPVLSDVAQNLLIHAAKDEHGMILRINAMSGLQVQTHRREFVWEQTPRAERRIQAAMDELQALGLIEDAGHEQQVYQVTDEGYKAADILSAQQSHKQE
jgi:hypothetical protein